MRCSHVKGEGRGRAHFGWSVSVLWERMGFRLDAGGCRCVRSRNKGLADIGHGMNKCRGGKEQGTCGKGRNKYKWC